MAETVLFLWAKFVAIETFWGSIFIGAGGNELSFLLLNYLLIKAFVSLLLSKIHGSE